MNIDKYIHTVDSCYGCDCWDSDYEACTMPSVDQKYACRQETEEFKIKSFYHNHKDFKAYVDSYSRVRCIPVEVALTHDLIKNAYQYYKSKEAT